MASKKTVFSKYLEDEEIIHVIVHKHWFVVVKAVLMTLLWGFLLPLFLYVLFEWFLVAMILWMAYAAIQLIYLLVDWYQDAWLITDKSVIDVRWHGIFSHSSERIEYASIEGVSYAYNGFFQTVLNYGDIEIQQHGGSVKIERIVAPKRASALISRYQEEFKDKQSFSDEEKLKDIMTAMIRRHIKSHGLDVDLDKVGQELELDLTKQPENVIDLGKLLERS